MLYKKFPSQTEVKSSKAFILFFIQIFISTAIKVIFIKYISIQNIKTILKYRIRILLLVLKKTVNGGIISRLACDCAKVPSVSALSLSHYSQTFCYLTEEHTSTSSAPGAAGRLVP